MTLGIEMFWERQRPNAKPCKLCKENIYSDMYVMVMQFGVERAEIMRVCQSCFDTMETKTWRDNLE